MHRDLEAAGLTSVDNKIRKTYDDEKGVVLIVVGAAKTPRWYRTPQSQWEMVGSSKSEKKQ